MRRLYSAVTVRRFGVGVTSVGAGAGAGELDIAVVRGALLCKLGVSGCLTDLDTERPMFSESVKAARFQTDSYGSAREVPVPEAVETPKAVDIGSVIARWRRTYRAAAKRDGYRHILQRHGYDPDNQTDEGPALVAGLLDVVGFVFAALAIDTQVDVEWTVAFLGRQRYGKPPADGLAVRVGPLPEAEVFLEDLGELDFEDLFDRFVLRHIFIESLTGEVSAETARAWVKQIRGDLTFEGDEYRLRWKHRGKFVDIDVSVK
jgi:hypothetical protein